MTQATDRRIRRNHDVTGDTFLAELQRVIEVAPVAPEAIDVVLWDGGVQTCLGTFADKSVAERHRQAVIDGVMAVRMRVAA